MRIYFHSIDAKNGPSYLLKQGIDQERAASIANGARVYQFLDSDIRAGRFPRLHLPAYIAYDPLGYVEILRDFRIDTGILFVYPVDNCVQMSACLRVAGRNKVSGPTPDETGP
jgi:hypothetical protein